MVNHRDERLNQIFAALADPTRRSIVKRLSRSEATVSELAAPFSISAPAISKHLRVLETAQLIQRTRIGRVHHVKLRPQSIDLATRCLAGYREFWERQLDALTEFLEAPTEPPANPKRTRKKTRRSR